MAYEKIALLDIKKIDVVITTGMTATQVYETYKPDYMLNGALYDVNTKTNIVNMKDESKSSGYLFSEKGIGVVGDNKLIWCSKSNSVVRDFIGGAPTLVVDSKKTIDWGNKVSDYVNGSHRRSVVGFSDKYLYLLASDHDNTIDGLADYCVQHGMKYAINLDGGGSCHLQKGTSVIKKSTRANCSWILVYLKVKPPVEDVTKSNRDVTSLQPLSQKAAKLFLDECKRQGLEVLVTEYHRSQARQDYLYEQGRTRPGNVVTWTRSSNHTSGYAWDICKNVKGQEYSDKSFFNKCGEVAKNLGIEWGGTWSTPDTPHFQINKDWKEPVVGQGDEVVSRTRLILNGIEKEVETINKDGSNFIKIRDLADGSIIVDYDSAKKMPVVKVKGL